MEIETILLEAHTRGHNAAQNANPQMIAVRGYESEPFPICGFATVRVTGLRGKVLAELKSYGFRKYSLGIGLSVGDYGQSYDRKSAYARAYTQTLKDHGFNAWSESRLD
jgi:hypothetical protein